MITTFTMNRKSAEKVAGFNGIDKSGKYVGTLTQVEVAESKAGATYVEFAFKALRWTECGEAAEERGEKMAFIRLFVSSRNGDRTFGADIMDALLAVLKLDKVEATQAQVFNRDGTKRPGYPSARSRARPSACSSSVRTASMSTKARSRRPTR